MAIVDAKRLNIAVEILEDYCEVFDKKEYDLLSEMKRRCFSMLLYFLKRLLFVCRITEIIH